MLKRKIKTFLISVSLTLLCAGRCIALDDCGYVFQIDTSVMMLQNSLEDYLLQQRVDEMLDQSDVISAEHSLFATDDYELIEELTRLGMLDHYSIDFEFELTGFADDEAYYDTQEWPTGMLGCKYAEDNSIDGSGVTVGILDSGLANDFYKYSPSNIIQGKNFMASATDISASFDTDDTYGHGTQAASIIAENTIGIAKGVNIVPLKCFSAKSAKSSVIMKGIYAAVDDYHCDILNMSFASTVTSTAFDNCINYALESGMILVAANGNITGAFGNNTSYYPASCDGVIAVGSVNNKKEVSAFSIRNEVVDIVAPGESLKMLNCDCGYVWGSGTSFSCPYAAAAAALALEAGGKNQLQKFVLTASDFSSLLRETAEDLGAAGRDDSYGYGLMNVGLLLASIRNDSSSVILSKTADGCSISKVASDGANPAAMACFSEDGRQLGCKFFAAGKDGLNNCPVPAGTSWVLTVKYSAENYIPLSEEIRY